MTNLGKMIVSTSFQNPAKARLEALAMSTKSFSIVEQEDLSNKDAGFDQILLSADNTIHRLLVTSKSRATPMEIWGTINQMKRNTPSDVIPVLFAPIVSPRVAQICQENQIGFLDAQGNCHIQAPGLIIHVEGHEPVKRERSTQVDVFAQKSSRVIRVMLQDVKKGWWGKSLARETGVSPALITRITKTLLEQAFAETRDGFLYIRDPLGLLKTWTHAYVRDKHVNFYGTTCQKLYTMLQPEVIHERIKQWTIDHSYKYALSGFTGAWLTAPMVRQNVFNAYMSGGWNVPVFIPFVLHKLNAKPVDSGANLSLLSPTDEYTFYGSHEINGSTVLSPIQLYLDLSKLGGRGEEAAQEILEKELLPKWRA